MSIAGIMLDKLSVSFKFLEPRAAAILSFLINASKDEPLDDNYCNSCKLWLRTEVGKTTAANAVVDWFVCTNINRIAIVKIKDTTITRLGLSIMHIWRSCKLFLCPFGT